MDEFPGYIYVYTPVLAALLAVFGGVVLTISTKRLRQARIWLSLSALPLLLIPITYGWSARSSGLGIFVAAISAFLLGMIYYAGISFINEHIKDVERHSEGKDS
jgi:hypothetical protein